ncbi:MAG: ribonuclease HII [Desulfovibrionaceae bacterium]|nr:ribonuclease HII [Desulfovibrionaceae bacterium]
MPYQPSRRTVEDQGLLLPPRAEDSTLTAGIDEAGRGCLAGPVVAAAVVFAEGFDIVGLDDSKLLKETERERLAGEIRALALGWGLGLAWMDEIARLNILQATLLAMARAVAALRLRMGAGRTLPRDAALPATILIDGTQRIAPPFFRRYGIPLPEQRAIVDGDALVPSISAASVLAKTFRDRLLTRLDRRWPAYGFARHKGYGTREHRAALEAHGPCPLHRLDFHGVLPGTPQIQGRLC